VFIVNGFVLAVALHVIFTLMTRDVFVLWCGYDDDDDDFCFFVLGFGDDD